MVVEMHYDNEYPLYSPEARARLYNFYTPPWYSNGWWYISPWLWYDGNKHGTNVYPTWRTKILNAMTRPAPFTCSMWGIYNQNTGSGIVYAKFRNDSTITFSGRIRFVLTEDSVYFAAPNGDNWHNHVARDYLPDTGGTAVTINPGDSVIVSRNFTIQPDWNVNKCEIVTWIQCDTMLPDSTKEIWQAGIVKVTDLTGIGEMISQKPTSTEVVPIPNPCVDHTTFIFSQGIGEPYCISIFDITGKKLREFKGIAAKNAIEIVEWDLKDKAGKKVNPGIYFYIFTTFSKITSGKIVIR
ncbi:MAG: Omp28-related outer membrane protein [candidate division WOR-3 bacterium]